MERLNARAGLVSNWDSDDYQPQPPLETYYESKLCSSAPELLMQYLNLEGETQPSAPPPQPDW